MNTLKLSREPLDVGKIIKMASSESCGANSIFVETTRDYFKEKKVIALECEPVALKQLDIICKELRNQWHDIANIVIFYRLGLVGVGEAIFVIAISSPDHETSLNAVAVAAADLKKLMTISKNVKFQEEASLLEKNETCRGCSSNKLKLFNEKMCLVEDSTPSSQLIQISVPEEEIKRRIQCFIEKKRNEIDLCNIMDFTDIKPERELLEANEENSTNNESETMMCARINSTVVKQEYSKCHLKVRKVKNSTGPQTRPNYLETLDKLMVPFNKENEQTHSIADEKKHRQSNLHSSMLKHSTNMERLRNIEDHLLIPPSRNENIHQRLKNIEDRLIFLESMSPEYNHFLVEKCFNKKSNTQHGMQMHSERKTYSTNQIDTILLKFNQPNIDNQDSIYNLV